MRIMKNVLGYNMRIYRKKRAWSQEDLAEKSNLHRTYISGIELGKRNPTLAIIYKIAGALNVKVSELLREQSE